MKKSRNIPTASAWGKRLAALGRLERAAEAARAAGNVEQAARLDQAAAALKGGRAGVAAREAATKKLSAEGKATLAKGQAAVAKHRERKLNAQQRQLQAHRLAAPGEMQERWRNQASGQIGGHGQPALAGVSGGGGKSSHAIGKPNGMMKMAAEGTEGEAFVRRLPIKPTGQPKGRPTGIPEGIKADTPAQQAHDIRRQNEAADALAYHGYKVEHKSPVVPSDNLKPTRDPDYRIEGRIFDGYAPGKNTSLDSMRDFMSKKVKKGQANSLLLNLTDSDLSADEIKTMLTDRKPVLGKQYGPLDQVIAVRPKPGAAPTIEGSTPVYKPEDMDIFNIFP